MSLRLFQEDVLFTQRLLKAEALYEGELDGIWGPLTNQAMRRFERLSLQLRSRLGRFDLRSETHISTLLLFTQHLARLFLARVLRAGQDVRIISGTRSFAQQDELFRRGRYGNPGPVVTNARGGQSLHNFGIAWDIGLFSHDGRYIVEATEYERAGAVGMAGAENLLLWGGNNPRFVDMPHYELRLGLTLTQVRDSVESGTPLLPYVQMDDPGEPS